MSVPDNVIQDELKPASFLKSLSIVDWVFAALLLAGSVFAYQKYAYLMDGYEVGILFGTALSLVALGWWWKQTRVLMFAIAAISLLAILLYEPAIANLNKDGLFGRDAVAALSSLDDKTHSKFLFKYFLSSTSAIMWMSALFVIATFAYFFATFIRNEFAGKVASGLTWSATTMGFVGLMVRWRESYLIGADIGHIPVSNLYEVFILFAVVTALIYLHYEGKYKTKTMGGFVLLIISASIAFLLWYHFEKGAHEISPLVPALKSYWMKIHVPANFIGYGAFALAAMLGVAYLIRSKIEKNNPSSQAIQMLPSLNMLDDVMHKSIALGFAFFTIATVLGAMWAAEAWGGYWSWDPKETWALIVWLNYAAWLHMRLTKGWRGAPLAWWAVIGLFITTFAFLGVNMFLSGLHSYGEL
jgi:cytochrome c-type biogenesis protein CcsB